MIEKRDRPLRFEEVTRDLRKWFLCNFNPGDSLPGDRELSKRFNVSNVTICKSMQCLVDEGLLERRPRSGSYLRDRKETLPVAVVTGIDLFHPAASQFFVRITGEIRNLLRDENINQELFIGHSAPGEFRLYHELTKEFLDAVDKMAVRAVILVGALLKPEVQEKLDAAGIPILSLGKKAPYGVTWDCRNTIRRAVRHLYAQRRRRFAIITPNPDLKKYSSPENPLEYFIEALEEVGVEVRNEWIGLTNHPAKPGAGWEETREIWISNPKEKPDVLFITDEVLFNNVSVALLEMNVEIPRELHVVTHLTAGLNNRFPFPVSRYEVDYKAQAREIINMLKQILSGEEPENPKVDVATELIMIEGSFNPSFLATTKTTKANINTPIEAI